MNRFKILFSYQFLRLHIFLQSPHACLHQQIKCISKHSCFYFVMLVELFYFFGIPRRKVVLFHISLVLNLTNIFSLHKALTTIVDAPGLPHPNKANEFLVCFFRFFERYFMPLFSNKPLEIALNHGGTKINKLKHFLLILTPVCLFIEFLERPFSLGKTWMRSMDNNCFGLIFERLNIRKAELFDQNT